MISNFFKKTSFLHIFIFFGLLSTILNYFFSVRFEENDDVCMLLISSGKYSGTIDNHLVFINFIYGSLLNLFYSFSKQIEWYTLSFIVINTIATSVIAKTILKSSYSVLLKTILFAFLLSIFINNSIILQFTRTAAILSIASLTAIYNTKHKYFGAFLFILGSLIRFEASILILLISSPLFLISTKNIKNYFFDKNFRIIIVTLFISLFCKAGDHLYYYMDSDWKNYMEYNKLRGKINDNPNAKYSHSGLPENIIKEDYQLLLDAHVNLYTINYDKLKQIYKSIEKASLIQKIKNSKKMISNYRYHLLLISLITLLFFYQNKEQRFKILLIFVIFSGLLFYISLTATVKPRIFYPSCFAIIFSFVFLNKKQNMGFINLAIFILILGFTCNLLNSSYNFDKLNKQNSNAFNRQSKLINKYLKSGNKLIPYGSSYRIEYSNPFYLSSTFPSQKILFSGWLTNSPFNKGKFDSFKYYKNNYSLLVNTKRTKAAQALILASILKQTSINMFPESILNKENISIIKFKKDITQTENYNN